MPGKKREEEAGVSEGSVTSDGRPELRFGCASHPETKVCPRSCEKAA